MRSLGWVTAPVMPHTLNSSASFFFQVFFNLLTGIHVDATSHTPHVQTPLLNKYNPSWQRHFLNAVTPPEVQIPRSPIWLGICGSCWEKSGPWSPQPTTYRTQRIHSKHSSARHTRHPQRSYNNAFKILFTMMWNMYLTWLLAWVLL